MARRWALQTTSTATSVITTLGTNIIGATTTRAIRAITTAIVHPRRKVLKNILVQVSTMLFKYNPLIFCTWCSRDFPALLMSIVDRNEKNTGATAFPQRVPWPNSNEARQEDLKHDVKGRVVIAEDQGLKDTTLVFSSYLLWRFLQTRASCSGTATTDVRREGGTRADKVVTVAARVFSEPLQTRADS